MGNSFGAIGEDIAILHLKKSGFRIIERNYREKFGEIDIIGVSKDGTLVFVEVKALSDPDGNIMPEDNLTYAKLSKLKKICAAYANHNHELVSEERGWRIDLVAITKKIRDGVVSSAIDDYNIRWYENVE